MVKASNSLFFENIKLELTILRTFRKRKHERKVFRITIFPFFVDTTRGEYPINFIGTNPSMISKKLNIPLFMARVIYIDRFVRRLAIEKDVLVREFLEKRLKPYKPKKAKYRENLCHICKKNHVPIHRRSRCNECAKKEDESHGLKRYPFILCGMCEKAFRPKRITQAYCSYKCRYEAKRRRIKSRLGYTMPKKTEIRGVSLSRVCIFSLLTQF